MNTIKKITGTVLATALLIVPVSSSYAAVSLTLKQKQQLQYLAEEEKLARDVYTYLAANVTTQKFSNIARAEQTHLNYVVSILKNYRITNPTATTKVGVFKDQTLQKLYNDLIASGSTGVSAAFAAGVTIEETDISDLKEIINLNYPSDVQAMLNSLLNGSQNHLSAFSR